jgi:hypothetical protein
MIEWVPWILVLLPQNKIVLKCMFFWGWTTHEKKPSKNCRKSKSRAILQTYHLLKSTNSHMHGVVKYHHVYNY